jgi:hypothetical protein
MTLGDTFEEPVADGALTLEYAAETSGTLRLRLLWDGQVVESGSYSGLFEEGHAGRTARGEFLNNAEQTLAEIDHFDAEDICAELREWVEDMAAEAEDAKAELRGPVASEVIDATDPPVEIHEAPDENTVWTVKLNFRGDTRRLEFDAGAMISNDTGTLENKIVHNFHERVEVPEDDWSDIQQYWADHSEVVSQSRESENEAVANRVLSYVRDSINPVADREMTANTVAAAWVDPDATQTTEPADGPIVWVQDDHLVDQLEQTGKTVSYKGQLIQSLKSEGKVYDKRRVRSWTEGTSRLTVWAFDADALDVTADDAVDPADNREVEP